MEGRPQFSLSESLLAMAFAAAGLALFRAVLAGGSDPSLPVVAFSGCCCFGAAVGAITHQARFAFATIFAALLAVIVVSIFFK